MQRALDCAKVQLGFCMPNPSVGAVVVKDGQMLSEGYHRGPGCPHAEPDALNKLGNEAIGATIYVTLEPCCTFGRTPPCTELLIRRGIKKVIYGYCDPNPNVAGKGISALENAGIICEYLPLPEISAFYQAYDYWHKTKLPWVTAKLALSLDGKIASDRSSPVQISSEALNRFTHQKRKESCAILTTSNTIISDNPQLNVRLNDVIYAKPLYLLDRELRIPENAKIFSTAKKVTIFYDKNAELTKLNVLKAHGIRCIEVKSYQCKIDWNDVMKCIGEDGVHYLWVEAGSKCFESLAISNYLCTGILYFCPKILEENAYSAFSKKEILNNVEIYQWEVVEKEAICYLHYRH